jgi:alpha-galactosidase
MFEIGDDLPTLFLDPQRMALVENRDLINMARLGRASKPVDLMTYTPEDGMPTTFFLRESNRQSVVTVFNWTDTVRHRRIGLDELGLGSTAHNQLLDIFAADAPVAKDTSAIDLDLPSRSVRMLKIIDTSSTPSAPNVRVKVPQEGQTGVAVEFSAIAEGNAVPAIAYFWDFGDGSSARESTVKHTFTHEGIFSVSLRVDGIDGDPYQKSFAVKIAGHIGTRFNPQDFERVPAKK